MLKNITLSADAKLIEKSRQRARRENKTLNQVFREWLARYASQGEAAVRYTELMDQLSHVRAGRAFTREEMNER